MYLIDSAGVTSRKSKGFLAFGNTCCIRQVDASDPWNTRICAPQQQLSYAGTNIRSVRQVTGGCDAMSSSH